MPLTVRPATRADAAAIVALHELPHVAGLLPVPSEARVRALMLSTNDPHFIFERDGELAGFVLCRLYDGWLVEIRRVIASVPRAGLGQFAMGVALRWAFERQRAHRVYLEVHVANAPARRLYERLGFVHEGTWRDGFRSDDGSYYDLCAYGLLAREYATHARSETS